jgi:hypothetical protein
MDRLDYYANSWLPARDLVIKALHERDDVDPSGKILLFEQFCPWKVCANPTFSGVLTLRMT